MSFRPEADAAIEAHSKKAEDAAGWGCHQDKVGASPHVLVTVDSADGFHHVFIVLNSEGLSWDEIEQQCMYDTLAEVRRRRRAG